MELTQGVGKRSKIMLMSISIKLDSPLHLETFAPSLAESDWFVLPVK